MNALKRMARLGMGLIMRFTHGMITCAEFDAFVVDYLDEHLPAQQRSRFERHLKVCPRCRQFMLDYRNTIQMNRDAMDYIDLPVPSEVPEELVLAVLKSRSA